MKKSLLFYGITMLVVVVFDRVTKWWALAVCAAKPYVVSSHLSFSLAYNRGMAWSVAASNDERAFVLVTALTIVVTACVVYGAYVRYQEGRTILGECVVVAGSLGNMYDRFVYGGVIDFIELNYAGWYWPTFNVADGAVVVGVGVMMYCYGRGEKP